MKKILYLFLIAIICVKPAHAQTKAVTETGEEVILNTDGTWHSASIKKGYSTRLDTLSYTKDKSATFLVKGQKIKYGIWIDPKKWQFKSGEELTGNENIEYFFTLKGEEAYAMSLPSHVPVELSTIRETVITRIKQMAPDARVLNEEFRKVNGKIVDEMDFACTLKGIKFIYETYCYSDDNGTMQLMAFTSENMYKQYKPEMEKLLNGFVTTAKE